MPRASRDEARSYRKVRVKARPGVDEGELELEVGKDGVVAIELDRDRELERDVRYWRCFDAAGNCIARHEYSKRDVCWRKNGQNN